MAWKEPPRQVLLWMDKILHHFESMGNHYMLVFTGGIILPGFLGWCEMDFVHPQHEKFTSAPRSTPGSTGISPSAAAGGSSARSPRRAHSQCPPRAKKERPRSPQGEVLMMCKGEPVGMQHVCLLVCLLACLLVCLFVCLFPCLFVCLLV